MASAKAAQHWPSCFRRSFVAVLLSPSSRQPSRRQVGCRKSSKPRRRAGERLAWAAAFALGGAHGAGTLAADRLARRLWDGRSFAGCREVLEPFMGLRVAKHDRTALRGLRRHARGIPAAATRMVACSRPQSGCCGCRRLARSRRFVCFRRSYPPSGTVAASCPRLALDACRGRRRQLALPSCHQPTLIARIRREPRVAGAHHAARTPPSPPHGRSVRRSPRPSPTRTCCNRD